MNRRIVSLACLAAVALSGCARETPLSTEEAQKALAPTGAVEEATESTRTSSGESVREVFDEARQLLSQANTNAAIAVMVKALDDPGLTESRAEIYKGITMLMLMAGRLDDVKERLVRDFSADPVLSRSSLGVVRTHYLMQGDYDSANAWVEHLLTLGLEDAMAATLREWQAVYQIELDAVGGKQGEAIDRFKALLKVASLPTCHHAFSIISNQAREKGDRALLDRLCMAVVGIPDAPDAMRAMAISAYCGAAADKQHVGEYADRVVTLLDAGVTPTMIRAPFIRDCRGLIQVADTDSVRRIIGTAEKLAALTDDAGGKDAYLGLALDGYVTLDDYRKAVAMVDAGFRRDNREWQPVMVPKLRAHLALDEGRTKEAIRYFREFMRAAAAANQTPSGSTLSRTLGMNAARIGDLWHGIGETDKATAAYTEARDHYTEALKAPGLLDEHQKDINDALERMAEQVDTP